MVDRAANKDGANRATSARMRNGSPFSKALAEMQKRPPNLERAYTYFLQAHELGDPKATYALGTWYLHGRHVKSDRKKGNAMIRDAAACAVPEAQHDFAVALETGDGVRKSERQATKFYLRAALQGDKDAMYEMGRCFYYGIGVKRDLTIARIFLGASGQGILVGNSNKAKSRNSAANKKR